MSKLLFHFIFEKKLKKLKKIVNENWMKLWIEQKMSRFEYSGARLNREDTYLYSCMIGWEINETLKGNIITIWFSEWKTKKMNDWKKKKKDGGVDKHGDNHMHEYGRIYICTCTHSYMHTYIRICIYPYMHTYIHPYIRAYMHVHMHSFVYTYIHTYKHLYIWPVTHSYFFAYA